MSVLEQTLCAQLNDCDAAAQFAAELHDQCRDDFAAAKLVADLLGLDDVDRVRRAIIVLRMKRAEGG